MPRSDDHLHHDHECLCNQRPDEPVASELDEALDEGLRSVRIGRRSLLTGLGLAAGVPILATACSSGSSGPAPTSTTAGAKPISSVDNKLKLVLLGVSAGPPVESFGTGIASALVVNDSTYIVDCGRSSVTQFEASGLRFDSIKSIFLTHLHADHIADYYNFFMLGGHIKNLVADDHIEQRVQVFGPGKAGGLPPKWTPNGPSTDVPTLPPGDTGTVEMTNLLNQAYCYSMNIFLRDMAVADVRTLMAVEDIQLPAGTNASPMDWEHGSTAPAMDPFEIFRDDNVVVTAILVPHGVVFPAYAFRFDTEYGSVTFSGDTTHTPNLIKLAQESDILVHEAIGGNGEGIPDANYQHMKDSHVFIDEVGPIAEQSETKHLVISHYGDLHAPTPDLATYQRLAQEGYSGEVTIGQDLDVFGLGSGP